MLGNLDKHRSDLKALVLLGEEMLIDLSLRDAPIDGEQAAAARRVRGCFEREYQRWYTEAAALIDQLIPGRAGEFERLYLGEARRKSSDAAAYSIQDWLTGRPALPADAASGNSFSPILAISMRLKTQLEILRSAEARFQSSLFDIRRLARADLFDSELDACRELAAHGFLRAAGTVAGVLLEKRLRQVIADRGLEIRKPEPTINDFNDLLKKAGALDVPSWRHIQRLGDVRNLCVHDKHREPTREEVEELIDGVERIIELPL